MLVLWQPEEHKKIKNGKNDTEWIVQLRIFINSKKEMQIVLFYMIQKAFKYIIVFKWYAYFTCILLFSHVLYYGQGDGGSGNYSGSTGHEEYTWDGKPVLGKT